MAQKYQHPLTPPPRLVEELQDLGNLDAIQLAYQFGADHELAACCEWFREFYKGETWMPRDLKTLRSARRPAPKPSLKEQALAELDNLVKAAKDFGFGGTNPEAIRKLLEALPND